MDFAMREPCKRCGETAGRIEPKNGQDLVFCINCGKHNYNAPRTETGKVQRSLTTARNGLKPSVRSRILQRDGGKCNLCGRSPRVHNVILNVDHILPVEAGVKVGLSDAEINHEENLWAICEECNSGKSNSVLALRLAASILRLRIAESENGEST